MSTRILVVESQQDNRQIIRDMLATTDYEITETENGEQALAAIAKQQPDLILMGIQLPIMDGYTATRRIKADPGLRSIPVIAVTSFALNGEEQTARVAGCDDYVPKPFSPLSYWRKSGNICPKSGINCCSACVRFWHKADIPRLSSDVRFWGQSGHRCLPSECLFPKRTFTHDGARPDHPVGVVGIPFFDGPSQPFFWLRHALGGDNQNGDAADYQR